MAEIFLFSPNAATIANIIRDRYAVEPLAAPSITRLKSMLSSGDPPLAVYIDDQRLSADEILAVAHLALQRQTQVIVGVYGQQSTLSSQLGRMSIPSLEAPDVEQVIAELSARLGLSRRLASNMVLIAVASAKGGIGKSLIASNLAMAMCMRGARVLVVDGDMTNSGIIPEFRIPHGYQSFLSLRSRDSAGFTPERVARCICSHESGIDFLLGADEYTPAQDIVISEWQAFMGAVQRLHEADRVYDVVLVDTGPDIKKRPYVIDVVQRGGWALLPVHPGRKERQGAAIALGILRDSGGTEFLRRSMALFIEAEHGAMVKPSQIAPLLEREFPEVHHVGVIPRDAHLVSLVSETPDAYLSPLQIAPYRPFSLAFHKACTQVAAMTGLHLPKGEPKEPWTHRIRQIFWKKRIELPSPSVGSGFARGEL